MAKKTGPKITSFLIADKVIQEKHTNKWSAIGIFDRILAVKYPCIHASMGLYIKLSDIQGKFKVRIEFCDVEGRVLSFFEGIELNVKSKLACPEFGINTSRLHIPKPGKYMFKLYFGEEFVDTISIEAVQIQEKGKK